MKVRVTYLVKKTADIEIDEKYNECVKMSDDVGNGNVTRKEKEYFYKNLDKLISSLEMKIAKEYITKSELFQEIEIIDNLDPNSEYYIYESE